MGLRTKCSQSGCASEGSYSPCTRPQMPQELDGVPSDISVEDRRNKLRYPNANYLPGAMPFENYFDGIEDAICRSEISQHSHPAFFQCDTYPSPEFAAIVATESL